MDECGSQRKDDRTLYSILYTLYSILYTLYCAFLSLRPLYPFPAPAPCGLSRPYLFGAVRLALPFQHGLGRLPRSHGHASGAAAASGGAQPGQATPSRAQCPRVPPASAWPPVASLLPCLGPGQRRMAFRAGHLPLLVRAQLHGRRLGVPQIVLLGGRLLSVDALSPI